MTIARVLSLYTYSIIMPPTNLCKYKQEEAKRFHETSLKMIQTKKKDTSQAEKECLDYIAKRIKISS
tara:strand:- start:203 stop:403 length:201 start_codon:yes stop_codon:yes gene_type:complete